VLARQKKLDEARERLGRGACDDAGRCTPDVAEGQLLRDAGRTRKPSPSWPSPSEAQPDQDDLLYEVSLAAEKLGQLDVVERHAAAPDCLKPESPQGYNASATPLPTTTSASTKPRNWSTRRWSLAPDDSFILDSKGWVLFRQGKLDAALETLKRAYAKQPDAEIAAHIGEVLWQAGAQGRSQNHLA
jgi:tetratricopeptide (TPR) repeat protein